MRVRFKKQPVAIQAAIIGGIFVIVATVLGKVLNIIQLSTSKAAVKIVDISLIDTIRFPTVLDVKVRNTGNNPAFIKRAEFHVAKVYSLKRSEYLKFIEVSGSYDVELQCSDTPYVTAIDLSQGIEPKGVDRFRFSFGCKDYSVEKVLVAATKVKLIYNESNDVAESKDVIFVIQPQWQICGSTAMEEETITQCIKYNIIVLEEIARSKAVKSEGVKNLINQMAIMKEYLRQK